MSKFGLYGPITSSAMTFSGPQKEPNSRQKRQYGNPHEPALLGGPNNGPPAKVQKISEDMGALRNGLSFYFFKIGFFII